MPFDSDGRDNATIWLQNRLVLTRSIAEIMAEWTGGYEELQRDGSSRWVSGRDGASGRWIADLIAASRALRVETYVGPDGRFRWRLPQRTLQ